VEVRVGRQRRAASHVELSMEAGAGEQQRLAVVWRLFLFDPVLYTQPLVISQPLLLSLAGCLAVTNQPIRKDTRSVTIKDKQFYSQRTSKHRATRWEHQHPATQHSAPLPLTLCTEAPLIVSGRLVSLLRCQPPLMRKVLLRLVAATARRCRGYTGMLLCCCAPVAALLLPTMLWACLPAVVVVVVMVVLTLAACTSLPLLLLLLLSAHARL